MSVTSAILNKLERFNSKTTESIQDITHNQIKCGPWYLPPETTKEQWHLEEYKKRSVRLCEEYLHLSDLLHETEQLLFKHVPEIAEQKQQEHILVMQARDEAVYDKMTLIQKDNSEIEHIQSLFDETSSLVIGAMIPSILSSAVATIYFCQNYHHIENSGQFGNMLLPERFQLYESLLETQIPSSLEAIANVLQCLENLANGNM